MTTSKAVDKVRAQRIKESDFWQSEIRSSEKGREEGEFLKNVKLIKLD